MKISLRFTVSTLVLMAVLLVGTHMPEASQADSAARAQPVDVEARIAKLGIELPAAAKPVAVYRPVVVVGKMAYLSGHIPIDEQGKIMTGRLGDGVSIAEGKRAARRSGLSMLASLKAEVGSLNRVKRVVKVTGMVTSAHDFYDQPAVVNGCSELFVDVFGRENGIAARSAVGMAALPKNSIVEIEAIFELH